MHALTEVTEEVIKDTFHNHHMANYLRPIVQNSWVDAFFTREGLKQGWAGDNVLSPGPGIHSLEYRI